MSNRNQVSTTTTGNFTLNKASTGGPLTRSQPNRKSVARIKRVHQESQAQIKAGAQRQDKGLLEDRDSGQKYICFTPNACAWMHTFSLACRSTGMP